MGKPAKPAPSITYTLKGTAGADRIEFGTGSLKLNGVDQSITPDATKITLTGGDGNDVVSTTSQPYSNGTPVFYDGGKGIDTIDFSSSDQAVAVNLYQTRSGNEPYIATDFALVSLAQESPSYFDADDPQQRLDLTTATVTHNLLNFESIIGSNFDDWLSAGPSSSRIDGGAGNDYILGWAGPDNLIGSEGSDFLFGKAGADTMTGGSGADRFQVLTLNGIDVITDFDPAEDYLYVGWQQSAEELLSFGNWFETTWTDASGAAHQAIQSNFDQGGVILVGLTLADVSSVNAVTTTFDWFA